MRTTPLILALAALFTCASTGVLAQAPNRERVTCYTTYDDDFFYLAAVVQKPKVTGKQTAPFSNPREDDAVAVYLQPLDTPVGEKRSASSVEMAVSAAGGAQIFRGEDAAPLKGFQD